MPRPRLDPAIFNLPVDKMRAGYYSDKYFVRSREVLRRDGASPHVTVQVFTKHDALLGGIDEAIAILKLCADETCRSVFYDRSKNRSGRWCSMSTCGNRAKVRAWRERQRADG